MGDNLPALRERDCGPPEDPLEAESVQQAIAISQWAGTAIAIGNQSKEEWIIAPAAYGLDWME